MNIRRALFALIMILCGGMSVLARNVVSLNFGWKFHAGDLNDAQQVQLDDRGWTMINLPHDFQIHQPWIAPEKSEKADNSDMASNVKSRLSARAFKEMGIGWYRKHLVADSLWKGKRVILDFEGIMLVGDVYFNGEYIGGTDYGYLGFELDITDRLRFGTDNTIAVKAKILCKNSLIL